MRFPRAFNVANRVYLTAATRAAAKRARVVCTISQQTRRDIVRFLNVPAQRVVVTYPAADERFRVLSTDEVDAFRRARDLPEVFIFAVGTLEPRKNVVGLLEAYARLPGPRPPLLIGGGSGWRFSPIFDTVQRLGLQSQVTFRGFVDEDELPRWYNAARLFVFPSLYEGFGLPVLEAMACGTPVITSNAASLPEVVGDAAVLVRPDDVDGFANAMIRLVNDAALRAELCKRGLERAKIFSWEHAARELVELYREVLLQDLRGFQKPPSSQTR
jgi:glycosyltransferase involved in cell wall biosynthesis